jgi:hypothetical protein
MHWISFLFGLKWHVQKPTGQSGCLGVYMLQFSKILPEILSNFTEKTSYFGHFRHFFAGGICTIAAVKETAMMHPGVVVCCVSLSFRLTWVEAPWWCCWGQVRVLMRHGCVSCTPRRAKKAGAMRPPGPLGGG